MANKFKIKSEPQRSNKLDAHKSHGIERMHASQRRNGIERMHASQRSNRIGMRVSHAVEERTSWKEAAMICLTSVSSLTKAERERRRPSGEREDEPRACSTPCDKK